MLVAYRTQRVAPTIAILKRKLLQLTHLKYCNPPKLALIKVIKKDFTMSLISTLKKSKWFILSAISHTRFKIPWVPDRYQQLSKTLFLSECFALKENDFGRTSYGDGCNTPNSQSSNENDSFYDDLHTKITSSLQITIENITSCEVQENGGNQDKHRNGDKRKRR